MIAATKRGSTVLQEFSYDPWGRRRDANNWNNYEVTEPTLFTRGFTGHEHIGGYGLINMNGRVYDPRLGRFLSPDPYIQSPFSQSFNRYSYVVNNPLKYIDPDGYRREYRSRAHPDELPPPQNNFGGGFINNNPNSPYYYPPFGGGFSGFGGGFMNPFSIGGGSWVNSFRVGIRPPGFGDNGPGFGGVYFDWYSGTYRCTITNGLRQKHWRDAYDVLIAHKLNPGGITLPPITYIWSGRRGSGRIVGGVPKWWGDHPAANGGGYNLLDGAGYLATTTSIGHSVKAYDTFNKHGWKNTSGKQFSSALLKRGNNGKYVRGVQGYRNSANLAKSTSQTLKATGKAFGLVGVGITIADGFSDGNLSWGDGAKIGIGLITTFTPVGWGYCLIDFGTYLVTGTSVTDRVGNYIDGL